MANRLNVANIGYNDATDALTIDSSGNVTAAGTLSAGTISEAVADAGVTIDGLTLKDGGIQFRTATGGSGTFGSGTLDDYEEGTWATSDVSGAGLSITTNGNSAFYVKIGNLVMIRISVTYPSNTDSSAAKLSIPFEQFGISYFAGEGSLGYTNANIGWFTPIIRNNQDGQSVLFYKDNATGVANSQLSQKRVDFTVTYRTT